MLKFYRILRLTLAAVFLASTAGIARYAAALYTQNSDLAGWIQIDGTGIN